MRLGLLACVLLTACGAPGLTPYSTCRTDEPPPPGDPSDLRGARLAPELLVPDVDTGVAYYRDALGFTVARNDAPQHSCFAVLTYGADGVLLSHVRRGWVPVDNQLELRFIVEDVDAAYARMTAGGAELVRDIGNAEYGLREYVVRDPYGVRLRFATPIP